MQKIDRPASVNDRAETPAMMIDAHSDPHDGSNDLDDGGDADSSETDLGVDTEQDGLHKRLAGDAVLAAEGSRTGDSADMPIVVDGDASAMDSSGIATPQSLEREQESHRGFDERIPLSIPDLN